MHIKQLPILEQIKKLQKLIDQYQALEREINSIRKEYSEDDLPPPLGAVLRDLKLQYAEEKIAESTAMVSPS